MQMEEESYFPVEEDEEIGNGISRMTQKMQSDSLSQS
jgi:hypothetical protein